MSDPNTGRLLGKRYQLQELIGTGAMGRVYRGKDTLLAGVPVAIKFLALSIQNQKMRLQERFEQEAKTCALLGQKSIHIVRVMDYGVDENSTPYYVMEYLQGQNLSAIIRNQNLSLSRFLSMARQICLGLQCAHNGIPLDGDGAIYPIIHRDIKPSNVLVIQDASFWELVKVLDFGIAKLLMSDSDQTKFYLGTLAYSSPEQIEGKELDNRSDIYSLGVMMFEMLTTKMPLIPSSHSFGAWYQTHKFQKPMSIAEANYTLKIPKPVEDMVMSCLEKRPSDRPQTISEIINVLALAEQQNKLQQKNNPNIPPSNQKLKINPKPENKTKDEQRVLPVVQKTVKTELRVSAINDDITRLTSWPSNKPIADIVFPEPIYNSGDFLPALWVMLPQQEIQKRLVCNRYNQFLFISVPHPIVLWITVIYNREHGAKWLPYYLDLKTNSGQEIIRLLQHKGYYRLLFFERETPTRCSHVLISTIPPIQCQRLQEWMEISKITTTSMNAQISKTLLKQEYEKLKPQILAKLQTIDTDSPFDLSG
jgi:serine/threonine-protein kinase